MPTVPKYERTEQLRPALRQNVTTQATPDDFGAGLGRGLQGLAQGAGQASAAFEAVRELEDTTAAKEADNQFAAWMRERQHGEGGYLTLQGRTAVEARKTFEDDVAKARTQFGEGLSPGARTAYGQASNARVNSALDTAVVHQGNQRKAWMRDASAARIETFAQDALAGYSNPALVTKNLAAGQAELRQQATLEGWDADTLRGRESAYISGVHKNVALRIAQSDPIAADKYRTEHAKSLTGADAYDVERTLGTAVKEASAIRAAETILSEARDLSQREEAPAATAAKPGQAGPTKSRALLLQRLVTKDRTEDVTGMDDSFAANLAAMIQDAPPGIAEGLGVLSGYRSEDRQEKLWNDALAKYGSADAARKWVAPPGKSMHNHGQAVDLAYNGQSLQNAPQEVLDWVHANAGKYGLHFPMAHEPWHVEPVGARGGTVAPRSNRLGPRTVMPSATDIEGRLSQIADPIVRDLTRKRLYVQIEAQNKAQEQAERAAKAELWRYVEQGKTPDQVPQDVRSAAGMASVSSAWSYIEETTKRGQPKDDDNLVYDMRRYSAEKPDQFAQIDLNDYRARLSPQTFKEMSTLQASAITDGRKARSEGAVLTSAFSQANAALEGVGISTAGKKGTDRQQTAERVARFNNALVDQIAEFKKANAEKNPNQLEIQGMINRLLLPVVIKSPSWSLNPFSGFKGERVIDDQFLFETGARDPAATVALSVPYETIPTDLRVAISADLLSELGRRPSEDEVAQRYNEILRDRIGGSPKP